MDCSKCIHIQMPHDGGHCYMFKDAPQGNCAQFRTDNEPPPGSVAATAFMMARMMPVEGDPDFWDRWKEDMKEGRI